MSCNDFWFLFFFLLFLFLFVFVFLFFFARLEFAYQELCEIRRVFLVPHFIYLTLPYLHNLRYVNLSNIRYLFTYQTYRPHLPTSSTSTHRHSGLSLHHYLVWSVPSIKSVPSSPYRTYRPYLSVKSCHLPYLKTFQFFPSYLVPMVIHSLP